MGKGFKHGTSGGANPLNFTVKTYPSETELKAAKPSGNTIGVITTTTMTSWVISATEPKEPEVGMLWLSVGNSSAVEFNALKSKTLMVYPLSAKQYEGGAWVDKIAYSYQNSEWSVWVRYLYNMGDECTDVTGGWSARAWSKTKSFAGKAPTVTKGEKSMTVSLTAPNKMYSGVVEIANDIDLTNFKKLTAVFPKIEATGTITNTSTYVGGWYGGIFIVPRNATYFSTDCVASADKGEEGKIGTFTNETLEIPLDELSGKYDVVLGINVWTGGTATVTAELESISLK